MSLSFKKISAVFLLIIVTILLTYLTVNQIQINFAINDKNLVNSCVSKGALKIQSEAQKKGCTVPGKNEIEVDYVKNDLLSFKKYVWFKSISPCNGKPIYTLTLYKGGFCR